MADWDKPIVDDGASDDNFDDLWRNTEAAREFEPLPAGRYRCLIVDGELATASTGTKSYKLTLEVLAPAEFAQRKLWLDFWLSPKALSRSKRDLARIGLVDPRQLKQPPPAGLVVEARVALQTEDDGRQRNRIADFRRLDDVPPADLRLDDQDGGIPF